MDGPPLRLAFVSTALPGGAGGVERVVIETANALAGRGHAVEIIGHDRDGAPTVYPVDPSVAHVRLQTSSSERGAARRLADRLRGRATRFAYATHLMRVPPFGRLTWLNQHGIFRVRLERHLARSRPDAVVAFLPPAFLSVAAARTQAAKVFSLHVPPEQEFTAPPPRSGQNPWMRRRMREVLPAFDAITVLLPRYRAWFPADLQPRVETIPNKVRPVAEVLPAEQREKLVIAAGRLHPQKRPELLIEAWARIADRFPDWRMEIYGEGAMRPTLEAAIARTAPDGRLRLMGHVADLPARLGRAALLAHPAAFEGFPLGVTEALAAGTPVAAFADCPGVDAVVADGVNGYLVAPGGDRAAAFAEGLARLMSDAALRARLGAAGPASMAPYAPETVIDLWEDVLRRAVATRKARG